MTQDEDNITTMFETTNGVLDDNNATWRATPAFVDAGGRGKAGTAALRQKQEDQAKTGATGVKQNARDDAVEETTLVIASQLSALAAKTDDPGLGAKVAIDKSTLDRMAVSDLIVTAKRVKEAADDNAAILDTDYRIKAADLTAFGAARSLPWRA